MKRSYYKRKHPKFKEVARYFNTLFREESLGYIEKANEIEEYYLFFLFREESLEYIEKANEIEEFFEQEADCLLSEVEADYQDDVYE